MKNNKLCKFSALVLAAAMVLAMIPVSALAGFSGWFSTWADAEEVSVETQATTGTITQPFESGTEGSTNFRIPAIVTLNDGTIVAAADARWSSASDSGGIDTLVAVSKDSGESWTHVWANYLGNNKNTKAQDSNYGTFIDPSLATDGDTVYMLVDLFPRGHHNGNVGLDGDAFVDDGHMRLSQGDAGNTEASYTYYLGDFNYMDYAQIFDSTTGYTVDGYTVDRWFNLYYNGVAAGNLFYDRAAYQAYPISYLYLTKSTDGGNTWSAPTLIDLKENGEIFYGTCPGGGYVTSTGRIIFPCYKANTIGWDYLCTSVIYSDDCGETWTRSANIGTVGYKTDKSTSESTLSEVTIDGKSYLYLFSRSNNSSVKQYFVSEDDGTTWEFGGSLTGDVGTVSYGTASALGSITYSKLIDGCPAIIFSAPASTSHSSGVIYVGLVQSDGTINFKYKTTVTSDDDYFKYSDLAELEDGRVALLYESAWTTKSAAAEITFEVFDIAELCEDKGKVTVEDKDSTSGITVAAPGLTSVKVENVNATYSNETVGLALNKSVTGVAAYDITPATASGSYQDNATIKISVANSWDPELVGAFTVEDGKIEDLGQVTVDADGYATINAKHFSVYGLYALAEGETFEEVVIKANEAINLKVGETSSTYTVDGTYGDTTAEQESIVSYTTKNRTESGETTYTLVTDATLPDGEYYVSTSQNDTNPTAHLIVVTENGSRYLKNDSGEYFYPTNSSSYGHYQSTISKGQTAVEIAKSGSGYTTTTTTTTFFGTTYHYHSLNVSNGEFTASNSSNANGKTVLYFYTAQTTEAGTFTDITFTGTGEGGTTVTVGNTAYNITVTARETSTAKTLSKNGSFTLDSGYSVESYNLNDCITISGNTITATEQTGEVTVVAVKKNSGGKVTDRVTYKITVTDAPADGTHKLVSANNVGESENSSAQKNITVRIGEAVTGLMLSYGSGTGFVNATDFTVKAGDGEIAGYTSSDEKVATVDENGKIVATGEGNCTITATFKDGSKTTIPVRVIQGDTQNNAATVRAFTIYVDKLYNSDLYLAVASGGRNGMVDTTWMQMTEGYVINVHLESARSSTDRRSGAIVFGTKASEGYATTMIAQSIKQTDGKDVLAAGKFNYIGRSGNDDRPWSEGNVGETEEKYYYTYSLTGNLVNDANGNAYGPYTKENLEKLLKNGIEDYDLEAAFHYTQTMHSDATANSDNGNNIRLQVISDKLPTFTKSIKSITKANNTTINFEEGATTVEIGDTINYEVEVTTYKPHSTDYTGSNTFGTITYKASWNDELTELSNESITLPNSTTSAGTITSTPLAVEQDTVTATTSLTLKNENFARVVQDGVITNIAELNYTYNAQHSRGTATAGASAKAEVVVTLPSYVVDFGLPVELDLQSVVGTMGNQIDSATVGTQKLTTNGYKVTYQPSEVFSEKPIMIKLTTTGKSNNIIGTGIYIIPASNVLYEENFLTAPTVDESKPNWKLAGNTTHNTRQAAETLAEYTNVYGYDPAYASITQANGVYQATGLTTQTMTAALTTTFTGTGFDLIGNCGYDTGRVMLVLKNQATNKRYVSIVDTRYGTANDDPLYQVPLAHREVPQGTYTVSIYASAAAAVEAASTSNAVSTYSVNRTSASSSDAFERYLKENNITDVEYIVMDDVLTASAQSVSAISTYATTVATVARPLGDHVEIDAFRVYYDTTEEANNPNTTSYNADEQNVQYVNILDVVENKIIAWTETDGSYSGEVTDYEANGGPENEIYLTGTSGSAQSGQAVTFQIADANSIQVSLRSVDGNEVKVGNHTIKSSTEMYYTIQSTDENGTFTIVNNGTGILGIGNVKIPGGMDEASILTASELDPEVVSYSIRMALAVEPDQPVEDEPEQPVTFVPEKINVSSRSVNVPGRKLVTVSVTASADVAYITVNGQKVNAWNNGLSWIYQPSTLRFTFTDLLKRGESKTYEIVAYNADGVASAVYTVQG